MQRYPVLLALIGFVDQPTAADAGEGEREPAEEGREAAGNDEGLLGRPNREPASLVVDGQEAWAENCAVPAPGLFLNLLKRIKFFVQCIQAFIHLVAGRLIERLQVF